MLACDWGAIRIFEDANGSLTEKSKQWATGELIGRWQSVAAGDFDGDGRIDLVAGNWGLNSFYHQAPDGQVELHFGDYNGLGEVEMIEAYRDRDGKIVPWRDMATLEPALPWLPQLFKTHAAFAAAALPELLGARRAKSTSVRTKTLASTIFFNRGGRFEAIPLPREAQYTPVFGISVADLDLDGFHDIALAQNFFAVRDGDGPLDAGRGLIVLGGAGGKLTTLAGTESGMIAYGEQRGCSLADFDQDGRIDLALGQNGTETKLFRNTAPRSGVRVRLLCNPPNVSAIGAQLRVEGSGVSELQTGAGYWSQDALVKVVRAPGDAPLQVRWPGGKANSYRIPPEAKEVELREDGSLAKVR